MRVLYRATPTVTWANYLLWSSPRTRDTNTCCWAFTSEAVTTFLNDFGLTWSGIEPLTLACETNALPLCHYEMSHVCALAGWALRSFGVKSKEIYQKSLKLGKSVHILIFLILLSVLPHCYIINVNNFKDFVICFI